MPTDEVKELPAFMDENLGGLELSRHLYHRAREILAVSIANQTKDLVEVRRELDKSFENPYLVDLRSILRVDEERRIVDGMIVHYKRLADGFCEYLKHTEKILATESPERAEARCRDDLLDGAVETLIHSAIVNQETHLALIERTVNLAPDKRPAEGCPACGLPKGAEADMCRQCVWRSTPEPEAAQVEEELPAKPDWTEEHGRQLLLVRQQKGWTQSEFGKKIGLSQRRISAWESAEESPSAEYLAVLLRLFGGPSGPLWQEPELGLLAEACLGVPPDTLPPPLEVEAA